MQGFSLIPQDEDASLSLEAEDTTFRRFLNPRSLRALFSRTPRPVSPSANVSATMSPFPVQGKPMGQVWYDYEAEGQDDRIVRVYAKRLGPAMRREVEALHALAGRPWVPRILAEFPDQGLYQHERPRGSKTLAEARDLLTTREAAYVWLKLGEAVRDLQLLGWYHTAICPEAIICAGRRVILRNWANSTRKVGYHKGRDCSASPAKREAGPFAPPEQARGIIGKDVDVYAWVGVLYWILTGQVPAQPRALAGTASAEPGASSAEALIFGLVLDANPANRTPDVPTIIRVAQKWFMTYYPQPEPQGQAAQLS